MGERGKEMDITTAATSAAAIFSAAIAAKYFFQNVQLRKILGKYTGEEIAKNAPTFTVSAKVEYAAMAFIDISSFTSFSEKYKPAFVADVLTIFFTTVSDNSKNGRIVKFMGDAVLLYFETCTDAVKTSMRLTRKLEDAFSKIEKVKIKATIGVHAGDVFIGTLGNSARADFTAIGDTVNLASRIQGLCKVYNEQLLISGDVMRGAKDFMPSFFPLDTVRVKGRKQAIDIYSMPTRNAEAYAAALSFYRSGNFEDAERAFENLKHIDPHNEVFEMWASRCRKNIAASLREWDGVYTMSEK